MTSRGRPRRSTFHRDCRSLFDTAWIEFFVMQAGIVADSHDQATILFADIVGFTSLSATLSAEALVGMLNRVFSHFDELCECHGLEKIKTIGDCYMVAAGVPEPRADHAAAICRMALDMQRYLRATPVLDDRHIEMRIGIHSGDLVAGVIGKRKFIYDLWGNTVNIAARVESTGSAGEIRVSASTRDQLGDEFSLSDLGPVPMKGVGEMQVWRLNP